jgi:uncharacterized protein (DUF362 family)
MPTRREFIGAVCAAAMFGCRGRQASPPDAGKETRPAKPAKPKQARPREEALPSVVASREDTLTGIRRFNSAPDADLVEVRGPQKKLPEMTRLAVEAIGGAKMLVSRGDRVVITPNFAWAKLPGAGVTTRPEIVNELVQICQEAGASDIVCLDYATDMTPRAYRINGAYRAIEGTRARLLSPWSAEQYVRVGDFERGETHRQKLGWQAVASVLLTCDTLISVPVIKHHRQVRLTGAIKKLMGCVWRRESYHRVGLHQCIAELGAILRPTLIVADATRILSENGPDGPGRVLEPDRLLAAFDPVLADAYACRWLKLRPEDVEYLPRAAKLGAGRLDTTKAKVEWVSVGG